MTRKDTILITVIINAGLLAVLFVTAVIYDADHVLDQIEMNPTLVEGKGAAPHDANLVAIAPAVDEVDHVLKYYAQPSLKMGSADFDASEPMEIQTLPYEESEVFHESLAAGLNDEQWTEVKVKKGDVLEKIARAHQTTVSAIKKFNHLNNENLSIGQVLKIPKKGTEKQTVAEVPKISPIIEPPKTDSAEPVYYVLKQGDNPWKIAKQFSVRYEDILRLNQLDEEKARNLRVGDRVRVK
ncbi:MAG: LysM peptidoglycan-binding domain-containing protein [Candidatus Protochlamydia sp.]|nr:LysM peptidoglycan-binding domain-containing protein [Candidatus Protochlamydia sp.]